MAAQDAYARTCSAAADNLTDAVNCCRVHNEVEVRGRQPRSSLNPLTVVAAASAWERFIFETAAVLKHAGDTARLASLALEETESSAGRSSFLLGQDRKWSWNLQRDLTVHCAFSWRGKQVRRVRTLVGNNADPVEGLTLFQVLDQWADLRNAIAHRTLQRTATVRTSDDRYRGPYECHVDGQRSTRLLWNSDADRETVQAGTARACLAFYVQLVDAVIARVAASQGWDSALLRLPSEWFTNSPESVAVWTYQLHREASTHPSAH